MITVIVDDRKFTLSMRTLNLSPGFIITQILNGSVPADSNPFVERINETTFEIDMDPKQFAQIIQTMRKEPRIMFSSAQCRNTSSIFQKPNRFDQSENFDVMLKQSVFVPIPVHGLPSTTDAHDLNWTESTTSNKMYNTLKPRKIELDTSENKN